MTIDSTVAGNAADLAGQRLAEVRSKKAAYRKQWVTKNAEKHKQNVLAWNAKNKGYMTEYTKARRLATPIVNLRESIKLGLRRKGGDITADIMLQMWLDQDGCCALSGIKMVWGGGKTGPTNMSIDRIDSNVGYFVGNVRLICHAVNSFRGKMSDDQLLHMAKTLVGGMSAKQSIEKICQGVLA